MDLMLRLDDWYARQPRWVRAPLLAALAYLLDAAVRRLAGGDTTVVASGRGDVVGIARQLLAVIVAGLAYAGARAVLDRRLAEGWSRYVGVVIAVWALGVALAVASFRSPMRLLAPAALLILGAMSLVAGGVAVLLWRMWRMVVDGAQPPSRESITGEPPAGHG